MEENTGLIITFVQTALMMVLHVTGGKKKHIQYFGGKTAT
jgi:hypothetical protein